MHRCQRDVYPSQTRLPQTLGTVSSWDPVDIARRRKARGLLLGREVRAQGGTRGCFGREGFVGEVNNESTER